MMSNQRNEPSIREPVRLTHATIHNDQGKICFRETYAEPDGRTSEWILHGATRVPVIVMPITDDGQVIALEQFRYGAGRTLLELPGGCIDEHQTAADTVGTELRQEAGYLPGTILTLDSDSERGTWFDPGSSRVRFLAFLAMHCVPTAVGPQPESTEHLQPQVMRLESWYRRLAKGEIRDSKSFAVSMLALRHLPSALRQRAIQGMCE